LRRSGRNDALAEAAQLVGIHDLAHVREHLALLVLDVVADLRDQVS